MKYIMTDYVKHIALANTQPNKLPEYANDHMAE
nr:MAG TPA: hypothetical protein [Caudoviricetes sp.]